MFRNLWTGIRFTLLIAGACGVVYPLAMTGVSQAAFSTQANGSLVSDSTGRIIGSSLIGQCFYKTKTDRSGNVSFATTKDDQGNPVFVVDPRYFQGRPSFTVDTSTPPNPLPCNAANSAGSNLGPNSPALLSRVRGYTDYLRSLGVGLNPNGSRDPIPIDLVTGDFTGFDPDISEAGALAQVTMVASARHLDRSRVRRLVEDHLHGRTLGIFGAPHVTVLEINLALDNGGAA